VSGGHKEPSNRATIPPISDHQPLPLFTGHRLIEMTNFIHALVAVLAGNAVYLLLMPHLPPAARHVPMRPDLGLAVDFWLCLVFFGLIKTATTWRRKSNRDHKE